jgi:hypothetical protein
MIRRHLRPAFGAMKLRDIGVEDLDEYIDEKLTSAKDAPM